MTFTTERIVRVPTYIAALQTFLSDRRRAVRSVLQLRSCLEDVFTSKSFSELVESLIDAPVYEPQYGAAFSKIGAIRAIAPARKLRGALNLTLQHFFGLLSEVAGAFALDAVERDWADFADRVHASVELRDVRLRTYLLSELSNTTLRDEYATLVERLIEEHPHAVYPTSDYRECDGSIESSPDHLSVDAVMTLRTFATIRMVDRVFDVDRTDLRNIYRPLGRCICVIDENVQRDYGDLIALYFRTHGIRLETLVYRATEDDKQLAVVERMLGEFKQLGVSRNEPVLIVGGGVLADVGGLACALYGRNTPYVMVATSIVSGIDAGPSPRTCCDAFGYKNLIGAYHPPVLCLTDRFFFATLHEGWLRHGVAEILKIAAVRNAELFADLEAAQGGLIATRFGTIDCDVSSDIHHRSQKILGGAMRSYIESEYENLYETHQCRPHAYGHTWSPGFEIEAGLLHGHAVAIDMGFGAYLSHRVGWIDRPTLDRILGLISGYGLSLWHDILNDRDILWESHRKIIQKRGGNLVAPVPRGRIGNCGYLSDLSQSDLLSALADYRTLCETYPRAGRGIDAFCSDVGLAGLPASS